MRALVVKDVCNAIRIWSLRPGRDLNLAWGVSPMLSGIFYALALGCHGAARFRAAMLNYEHFDIRIGRWRDVVIWVVVQIEAAGLAAWLLYQAWRDDPGGWLRPFGAGAVVA